MSNDMRYFVILRKEVERLRNAEKMINKYTGKSVYAFCAEHDYDPFALLLFRLMPEGVYSTITGNLTLKFETQTDIMQWGSIIRELNIPDGREPEQKIVQMVEGWIGENVVYDRYYGNLQPTDYANTFGYIRLTGCDRKRRFILTKGLTQDESDMLWLAPAGTNLIDVITTCSNGLVRNKQSILREKKYKRYTELYTQQGINTMLLFVHTAMDIYTSVWMSDISAAYKNTAWTNSYRVILPKNTQFKPLTELIKPFI